MNTLSFLISEVSWIDYEVRKVLEPLFLFLMVALAIATVVVILMQKSTSNNIGTIAGESETYMGKNKGHNRDRVLKITTLVLGACLLIISVLYFVIAAK